MAEVEGDNVIDAEERVAVEPNLLQYYETEVEIEEDEYDPLRVDINIRKHFEIYMQLNKIDKEHYRGVDKSTVEVIYESPTTKGLVVTAQAILSKYVFVFYLPFRRDHAKVVKVLSDVAEHVVGKLISEDLAKGKPSVLDESLA